MQIRYTPIPRCGPLTILSALMPDDPKLTPKKKASNYCFFLFFSRSHWQKALYLTQSYIFKYYHLKGAFSTTFRKIRKKFAFSEDFRGDFGNQNDFRGDYTLGGILGL